MNTRSVGVRHLRSREARFFGLLAVTFCLIVVYLGAEHRLAQQSGSSWRKVDVQALMRRIDSGELRDHEASWYHPVDQEGAATGAGMR